MKKPESKKASIRARDFPWPPGYARITFDLDRTIGSRYSMEFMAKMLLVAVTTWEDLVTPDEFSVLQRLFALRNSIFGPQTQESLEDLKQFTAEWISDCQAAWGTQFIDKPNTHALIELVWRDLPLYGSGQLLTTHHYERHHERSSHFCLTDTHGLFAAVKHSESLTKSLLPELFALKQEDRIETLRFVLHGGVWFDPTDGSARQLGDGVRFLMDPREQRTHELHPLLRAITSYTDLPLRDHELASFSGNGCWVPCSYRWHEWKSGARGGKLDETPLSAPELTVLRSALARDFPLLTAEAKSGELRVFYPTKLLDCVGPRKRRVGLNHDVKVMFEGRVEFLRISKLVLVKWEEKTLPYLFPHWYQRSDGQSAGQLLGVTVVQAMAINSSSYNLPQPVSVILEQVLLTHVCKRKCLTRGHDANSCSCTCRERDLCNAHQSPVCSEAICSGDKSKWHLSEWHVPRGSFLVFDHAHGFIVDAPQR